MDSIHTIATLLPPCLITFSGKFSVCLISGRRKHSQKSARNSTNSRSNLQNVWFHVQKNHSISDINRVYSMISTSKAHAERKDAHNNRLNHVNVSRRTWKVMLPHMKAFRLKDENTICSQELLYMLPNFTNLTQLDVVVSKDFIGKKLLRSKCKVKETVKLEHLEHLRISPHCSVFLMVNTSK